MTKERSKPEKYDHRDKDGQLISVGERDIHNQCCDDWQSYLDTLLGEGLEERLEKCLNKPEARIFRHPLMIEEVITAICSELRRGK